NLGSLRVVITGGASAAMETIRSFQANMHGHLIELYGMLETGFHTYTRFEDDPQAVNGTIGRVVGEMELRIIDERGADVPHGEMVGLPDARLGERNCLCVVPKDGAKLELAEVLEFLKGQVADYKLPETLEHFTELPLTGTGKLRRHILRDWVLERHRGKVKSGAWRR